MACNMVLGLFDQEVVFQKIPSMYCGLFLNTKYMLSMCIGISSFAWNSSGTVRQKFDLFYSGVLYSLVGVPQVIANISVYTLTFTSDKDKCIVKKAVSALC